MARRRPHLDVDDARGKRSQRRAADDASVETRRLAQAGRGSDFRRARIPPSIAAGRGWLAANTGEMARGPKITNHCPGFREPNLAGLFRQRYRQYAGGFWHARRSAVAS